MSVELPPSIRAAAGLAGRTLDEARRLPNRLVSLPVVAAGAAMQASLRLQQEYAGLVARGDELILQLRGGGGEAPAWATFDEDVAAESQPAGAAQGRGDTVAQRRSGVEPLLSPAGTEPSAYDLAGEPSAYDLAGEPSDALGGPDRDLLVSTDDLLEATATVAAAAPVPGYDDWTVAQLRARLRRLSSGQLAELLAYERAGRQRAPYLTMLQNRLAATSKG